MVLSIFGFLVLATLIVVLILTITRRNENLRWKLCAGLVPSFLILSVINFAHSSLLWGLADLVLAGLYVYIGRAALENDKAQK